MFSDFAAIDQPKFSLVNLIVKEFQEPLTVVVDGLKNNVRFRVHVKIDVSAGVDLGNLELFQIIKFEAILALISQNCTKFLLFDFIFFHIVIEYHSLLFVS